MAGEGTTALLPAPPSGEDDLVSLSALQHYLYCPRQCALIHLEQAWAENRFTAEGRVMHERSHERSAGARRGVRTLTALPIRSLALGVTGIADVVELHEAEGAAAPYPIEYKRGKPKRHRADEVQLCAQGIALEEMFGIPVPEGALFYGETRRRLEVPLDAELRALTASIAAATRALVASGRTPPPEYEARKCNACSLLDLCRPRGLARRARAAGWLAAAIEG